MNKPLNCIVCDKQLEFALPNITNNQPHRGTCFQASGQYGSTVFDPMNPRVSLEINVCDECLIKKRQHVLLVITDPQRPIVTTKPWNGNDDK